MRSSFLLTLLLLLYSGSGFSQTKVKLKKNTVYLNGEEFLSFEKKSHGAELVVYELNTKNELFSAIGNLGDPNIDSDDIYKLIFAESGKSMEYSPPYWNKRLIQWLLEQEVLTSDGTINEEKLDSFIKKYDEKLTERTLRGN